MSLGHYHFHMIINWTGNLRAFQMSFHLYFTYPLMQPGKNVSFRIGGSQSVVTVIQISN